MEPNFIFLWKKNHTYTKVSLFDKSYLQTFHHESKTEIFQQQKKYRKKSKNFKNFATFWRVDF